MPIDGWGACLIAVFIVIGLALMQGYPIEPPVGFAIGLLAAAAAIMAVRTDHFSKWEKVVWVVVAFLLFRVEVKAIYHDRDEHDEAVKAEHRLLEKNFTAIANGLQESITKSQTGFEKTLAANNDVMVNITGGESFAVVLPLVFGQKDQSSVPLVIENHGTHPLMGVSMTVYHYGAWTPGMIQDVLNSVASRVAVGTLHSGERRMLGTQLLPQNMMKLDEEDDSGEAFRTFVTISAQNFSCSEFLDFRHAKDGHWEFKYDVYKTNSRFSRIPIEKRKVVPDALLESTRWSDDPNRLTYRYPSPSQATAIKRRASMRSQ